MTLTEIAALLTALAAVIRAVAYAYVVKRRGKELPYERNG